MEGVCLNLPRAGCPHKLSDWARRGLVREATKTDTTSLKKLRASVLQMGETVHAATVAWVPHLSKLYGRASKRKPLLKKSSHEISPGMYQKACGRLQGQFEEGYFI